MRGSFVFNPIGGKLTEKQKQDRRELQEEYDYLIDQSEAAQTPARMRDNFEKRIQEIEQRLAELDEIEQESSVEEEDEEEVFKQPSAPKKKPNPKRKLNFGPSSPKRSVPDTPLKRTRTPALESPEKRMIQVWTRELNNLISRALQPLMTVVGMVATRLRYDDVRYLLAWKEDAPLVGDRLMVVKPADTVEMFIAQNHFLGSDLLRMYISTYTPQHKEEKGYILSESSIGRESCFDIDMSDPTALDGFIMDRTRNMNSATARALENLAHSEVERQFAPAWAFNVIGSGIFRAVLSTTCFGAFEAAADQIRSIRNCRTYTIKELICSPSVRRNYARMVASQYLLSGDNIHKHDKGKSWYSSRSTYQNITQMRQVEAEAIYTCMIWFESVFATQNTLLQDFEAEKRKRLQAFQMSREQLAAHRAMQFQRDPTWERAQDLATLLNDAGLDFQQFSDQMNAFLAIQEDATSSPDDKSRALVTITITVNQNWTDLMRVGGDAFYNQQFAQVKAETEKNLDQLKKMLPQRELVYRG